jgi:hypothetical protein
MLIGHGATNDKFRERTAASPPLVLRPKRCACGKATTSKQLAQYRQCVACVRAAAASAKVEAAA